MRPRPPLLPKAVLAVAAMCSLTACEEEVTGGHDVRIDAEQCSLLREQAEKVEVPPGKKPAALVVDSTASGRFAALPPAVVTKLTEAQRDGTSLVAVAVDGPGAVPRMLRVALDPAPGKESGQADLQRRMLAPCLGRWVREEGMLPTARGSDVLAALNEAARQRPSSIMVMSDGVSTASPLDLGGIGFDVHPGRTAERVKAAKQLDPALAGVEVLWTGLGDTAPSLPQPVRANLEDLWKAVLVAAGTNDPKFDSASGQAVERPAELPADDVVIPVIDTHPVGCAREHDIPGALLFAGNDSTLAPRASDLLAGIATELVSSPTKVALVAGHAAAYGDTAGRVARSRERAVAVTNALRDLGVTDEQLTVRWFGSDRPLVDEFPGGVHDGRAAARNRRVAITVAERECASWVS